jgi:hypothetical protein
VTSGGFRHCHESLKKTIIDLPVKWLERFLYRHADLLVVNSPDLSPTSKHAAERKST